jgi:hypothetical protein
MRSRWYKQLGLNFQEGFEETVLHCFFGILFRCAKDSLGNLQQRSLVFLIEKPRTTINVSRYCIRYLRIINQIAKFLSFPQHASS